MDRNDFKTIAYVTVNDGQDWRWLGNDDGVTATADVDTSFITHINFAFGVIEVLRAEPNGEPLRLPDGRTASEEAFRGEDGKCHYRLTLNGWIDERRKVIDGRRHLRALVELKKQKPSLKVLISVGGWGADGFCYMARTAESRHEFIESCIELLQEYDADGIDLDWEFPFNGGWGTIACCDHCVDDARLLIREMRTAFDKAFSSHKLVTIASNSCQPWVDRDTLDALDYINVMTYDYAPLKDMPQADMDFAKASMITHIDYLGDDDISRKKLNMGIPFYNSGSGKFVPYYKKWDGRYVDISPESIVEKAEWIREMRLGGAFYWAYSMDICECDELVRTTDRPRILQSTLYNSLKV